MNYALCESVHAGPDWPWHIRPVNQNGLHLGGGANTPALCGRTVAWDLDVPITRQHLAHACPRCAEEYQKLIGVSLKTGGA